MIKITLILLLTLTFSLLISACSPEAELDDKRTEPVTLSTELAAIYQRSCKNCHEVGATGAPLTGDTERWNTILDKGMATVLDRAMSGYQGMPAFGQCFACSPEQIKALIIYMSNPAQ
ncbi:MAG: cytochrome c5 [Oleiphilaceae bacterium]|jgi:cytochrome c5